jgi:Rod binding domain-containing protein
MNIFGTQPRVEASQLPLESLAGNTNISDADKVAEVSRQFEAVLLRQILQDIRKPMLAPAQGDATANGIYDDMVNNQMAESISRSGGFGLANSLAEQLTDQVLPHTASARAAGSLSMPKAPANEPFRKRKHE